MSGVAAGTATGVASPGDAAADLRTLAWLHAGEREVVTWLQLASAGFPQELALIPPEHPASQAMSAALQALGRCPLALREILDDELAADYAAIHLTHALRASPCESVWRDEDGLMLQAPTFAVREAYRRHGLGVADWRHLPDDHLAPQLVFVAHLLEAGQPGEAAGFLDEHLLQWLPAFAQRVDERCDVALHGALAQLTLAACEALRAQLPAVPATLPTFAVPDAAAGGRHACSRA